MLLTDRVSPLRTIHPPAIDCGGSLAVLIDSVRTALADRYRIERELGRGGMATVYLAEDLKHHGRKLAIKVLDPELAAAIGPERFLREIEIVSGLSHPHILPLHDSGSAAGLLYYVMPYAEGESLRARLVRETQLPVDDALRLAREVALALAYAHRRGKVHRDIKPENILLSSGQAVVADFGIAGALEPRDAARLTATGILLCTPIYASPEQMAGNARPDGRSDLYSLACVLYEVLAGQPPFTGASAESLAHQHLSVAPRRVTELRPSVPARVADALAKALSKNPADRHSTLEEFADDLGAANPPVLPLVPKPSPVRRRRLLVAATIVIAVGAAGAAAWPWIRDRLNPGPPLDPELVAVFPFRVSGSDPNLGYLREGMVDLLAAKLTGEAGPRAIEPRTILAALPKGSHAADLPEIDALRLALRLGAAHAVFGSVVATSGRLLLSASVSGSRSGGKPAHVEAQGPADSLARLVDQLTALLLAEFSGNTGLERAELTTRSLPALRAFLAGQAAQRRGQTEKSLEHFERAIDVDSTFALAALGAYKAKIWMGVADSLTDRAGRLAWAGRDRLGSRDRATVVAWLGPRYPARSTERERINALEHVVRIAPERAESWYLLGNKLYHHGRLFAMPDAWSRARAALREARELDPSYAAPIIDLFEMAVVDRDTAAVRELADRYVALGPSGEWAEYFRFLAALVLEDAPALATLRSRMPKMDLRTLRGLGYKLNEFEIGISDAQRASELAAKRASTREDRFAAYRDWALREFDWGRPRRARELLREARAVELTPGFADRMEIQAALFSEGDEEAAREAFQRQLPFANAAPPDDRELRRPHYFALYSVELWRLAHDDPSHTRSVTRRLSNTFYRSDSLFFTADTPARELVLPALLASVEGRSDATAATRSLDSLLVAGSSWLPEGNLVVARLLERHGDRRAALAALRRGNGGAGVWLSTYLREEGRLAALAGDRNVAIKAYRHYLALRSDPEPELRPEVERIRQALVRLQAPVP